MELQTLLIPVLVFVVIVSVGVVILSLRGSKKRELAQRLHGSGAAYPAAQPVGHSPGVDLLQKVGAASSGKKSSKLQQELVRAGFHSKTAADIYLGAKVLLLIVGCIAGVLLMVPSDKSMPIKLMGIIAIGGIFSFLPNMYISVRRKNRTAEVRRTLPDATDLLEICVSAGMGLDTAWTSVTDEVRRVSDVLADEMALTNLEIQLGAQRHVAMRHMAQRTGAPELSTLVAVLVQSERFGTSIADALRTFAGTMREERSQRAEESAEKMSLKMLFPMVLFIFPAVFIVLVGPAAIRISETLLK